MSEHASEHRTSNSQKSAESKSNTAVTEVLNPMDTRQLTPAKMLQLQRTMGNRAVQGMVQRMGNASSVVQRAGGSTSSSATTAPTAAELRKTEMDAERDANVPNLVTTAFDEIKSKVKDSLVSYLTTDAKAASIRTNVKQSIINEINQNIETAGGTEEQKKDAKKYSEGTAAPIMMDKLRELGDTTATGQVGEPKRIELTAAAAILYDSVVPSTGASAFDKQKAKAKTDAKKKLDTMAKSAIAAAVNAAKAGFAAQFAASGPGIGAVNVGTAGAAEITKRKDLDPTLVIAPDMKSVFETVLLEPMKKAVLLKLGVGRREFRRSKELNEFRQKLKDEARAKAREEVDSIIGAGTHASMAGKGEKAKEYHAMAAKIKTYDTAKVEVDALMGAEADTIVGTVIPEADTIVALTTPGKAAAYDVARTMPQAADKIKAAGIAAAKGKATELLEKKKPEAIIAARAITKGVKAVAGGAGVAPVAASGRDVNKTNALVTNVKKKVHDNEVASKAIKASVEAGDLQSGFTKVGKLIDISTPNSGDASSMDIELKIPVASAAGGGTGYFLFGFGGEAEREDNELSVNTQLTFGGGFQTFGFDANFRVGLYLEGKGKDTNGVMNLLSYGLYREMNSISKAAVGHFWGQGGKSGDPSNKAATKLLEAEQWAMMIEEQNMDDEAEVSVGLLTKLGMEANVGVAEFSAELAYKRLSSYTKAIIDRKGMKAGGGLMTAAERVNAIGGNAIGKGEIRNIFEAAAEIEVAFGKDKVAFGIEGSATRINGRTRELNLELSASIPSQFGEESGEFTQYAAKIVTAAVGGGKNIAGLIKKAIAAKEGNVESDVGKRSAGAVLDTGTDALFTGNYFDDIGTSFAEKIQGDETINDTMRSWLPGQEEGSSAIEQANKIALSNSLKLAAKFKKEYDETGAATDWEMGIEASQVKSLEVDAEVVKVAVEKSKRIGKLGYSSNKGWEGGLVGIEGSQRP